jgi:hypothetical protein
VKTSFTKKVLVSVMAICLVAAGALLALGATRAFPSFSLFDAKSETRDTQIINAITRTEQVALLSLGIQGISEKNQKGSFPFGIDVPGSERASFVQYGFNAKLGIEGKDVKMVQTGKADLLVSIPKFIFIGHDNESFRSVAEVNGVLSWVAPKIDTIEMINKILNNDAQKKYIDSNEEILRDQAKVFYTSIITSIDPTIAIRFEFHQ